MLTEILVCVSSCRPSQYSFSLYMYWFCIQIVYLLDHNFGLVNSDLVVCIQARLLTWVLWFRLLTDPLVSSSELGTLVSLSELGTLVSSSDLGSLVSSSELGTLVSSSDLSTLASSSDLGTLCSSRSWIL